MSKIEIYLIAADNPVGHPQRRPFFKRKRAGEVLTREQVAAIKAGRRLLRREMKDRGLKTREDFELTATGMGLYFDKGRLLLWLLWLFKGRGLWALLAAAGLLLAMLFGFSAVTQLRGHFTINMSDDMFREGFVLSDSVGFENPTTALFCTPAENVPCISINQIPADVDTIDGQHNSTYFAYTFYIRNEGDSTVDYDWYIRLNSESLNLSTACWVMVFEDGAMSFYAEADADGQAQALPPMDDNARGYLSLPVLPHCRDAEAQMPVIAEKNGMTYRRVVPYPFHSDTIVAGGTQTEVAPMDVHKYTVVIWLEGDDPHCTDALIGGHLGMDFNFRLVSEADTAEQSWWQRLFA